MRIKKLPVELKDLEIALVNLDFVNNFKSFEADVTIAAGQEINVRNQLNPKIPARFLVLDCKITSAGTHSLSRGLKDWNAETLTIKNSGTGSFAIKILFLE